jgi:hypothetical protein
MEGSSTTRKPRKKYNIPKPSAQENECTGEPNGGLKKDKNTHMLEETGGGDLPDLDILHFTFKEEDLITMERELDRYQ